ncbi:branched-chain amino acid ABC transporter permease [Dactylosporangium sp. CA-139066]|uniref:branched-chain amino acid ABC transporter permease n=1 Tax=Dactylosporangium sp. CA-139066 TaxID=3239930 RepID=UPI003D8D536D
MSLWYEANTTVIQQTLIYLVLAASFQVVLRAGVSSFASIAFYGVGGYLAANLATSGWPLPATLAVVLVTAAAIGWALAVPLTRLRGLYLGMATFAVDQIVLIFAANGGDFTGGTVGLFGIPSQFDTPLLVGLVVVAMVLISQLERGSLGRAFASLRVDENLTRAMGLEARRLRILMMVLSAVLGAVAGAANVLTFTVITPESFGFDLLITALTMAVVGGVRSWVGAVIGAVLVTWFPMVFTVLQGGWRQIVFGIVVVAVMVFEPDGLLGVGRRIWRRLQRSRRQSVEPDAAAQAASAAAERQKVRA